MDSVILFEEVQGRDKKSARDFFKILTGIFLVCLAINLLWQKGEINALTQALFLGIVIFVLISIFLNVKLVTQVRTDGIYVRYAPFQPSFSFYPWQSIDEIYIREYNALLEYGGWGVRVSSSGKAFIASGNAGVQMILKNGSKVLIGTNQVNENGIKKDGLVTDTLPACKLTRYIIPNYCQGSYEPSAVSHQM